MSETSNSGARCAACQKNKFQLRFRKSRLNGQKMLVCNTCFDAGYEPRWLVILSAQDDKDSPPVRDCLINHKYEGSEISALDLMI